MALAQLKSKMTTYTVCIVMPYICIVLKTGGHFCYTTFRLKVLLAKIKTFVVFFLTSVTQKSTNRIPKQNKTLIHQVVCNKRTG